MQPNGSSDENFAFVAELDNIRLFTNLLKAVNVKERANFFISMNGLKVTVQDSKTMQLSAFVEHGFFQEYTLRPGFGDEEGSDDLAFNVSLSIVMNCLELFGDSSTSHLKICYQGYGNPLVLYMDDQGVTMDCLVKTQDVEDCIDFNFANSSVLTKVIVNSEMFKEVVSTLNPSCSEVTLKINHDSLKFLTASEYGDTEVELKNTSRMVDTFICNAPVSATYNLSLLKQGLKPLSFSIKASIRIDSREFLSIQHLVSIDGEGQGFTEFYCIPNTDVEDD